MKIKISFRMLLPVLLFALCYLLCVTGTVLTVYAKSQKDRASIEHMLSAYETAHQNKNPDKWVSLSGEIGNGGTLLIPSAGVCVQLNNSYKPTIPLL